jgi:hypothetical protein
MKRIYLLTLVLVSLTILAEAQSFYSVRRNRSLIFSAGTGTATYFGELKNDGDIIDAKPNLNVGLQYFVSPRVALRGEVSWFQLTGTDAEADGGGRQFRNLSFVSNNYEIGLTGAFNLFPLGSRYYQRPTFNAYAFAGLGLLYFNPVAELNGVKHSLQPLMTEGVEYNRFQFVIPYGLGVKLKVGPFFNLALEGGYRMTFTDYLDDVSTVHPDKSTWTNPVAIALSDRGPEVGAAPRLVGSIRGNPEKNDGYFLMNVKIEYYLPTNFLFGNSQRGYYRNYRRKPGHR